MLALVACGSPAEPPETPRARRAQGAAAATAAAKGLASTLIAEVPAGTYGPYVGRTDAAGLAVWAARDGDRRKWFVAALGPDGSRRSAPRAIADAPAELGLVAIEPAAKGSFVVLSTRPDGEGTAVDALSVSAQGRLIGTPRTLDRGDEPVLWLDAVTTGQGALALWARQRGKAAALSTLAIDGRSSEPQLVADGARAWQVIEIGGGAALALVDAEAVKLLRLDAAGRRAGVSVIRAATTASLDLDAARLGDRIAVGWSDRDDDDAQIQIAVLDASGKVVVAPKPAFEATDGDQSLVRLVAPLGGGPAYVAWEAAGARPRGGRAVRLASLTSEGVVGSARGEVRVAAEDTLPELAASPRGIAALTLARVCAKTASAAECQQAERLPTFVELDRAFSPVAAEPMHLAALSGGAAELAWGLDCRAGGCLALAAIGSDPAPVYAVELAPRSGSWRAPAGPWVRKPPPRPQRIDTLAAIDPLADVAATRLGDATLAAWVTYFDPSTPYQRLKKPAPDGRFDPPRALLQVRRIPDRGEAPPPETISLRARSLGGVALSPGAPEHREALLVWTALDNGQPQVFTTIVDADGKKRLQRMLTRSKGEVSDVAATFVGDGWIVAWVDERHADPEVYVTKVNRMLQRVVPERRLTSAAGAATGVSLLSLGDRVLVTWADARDAEQPGWADPYVAFVKAMDAAPLGAEHRLATTRPHSFSPVAAWLGAQTVLAWLDGPDGSTGAARLALVDDKGQLAAPPVAVTLPGNPTALALDCTGDRCRFVAAVDVGSRGELATFDWRAGDAAPGSKRLAGLSGPAGQAAAPVLLGDALLYADQARDRGRVRRMTVEWK